MCPFGIDGDRGLAACGRLLLLFALVAGFLKGPTRYNPAQDLTLHSLLDSAPNLPLLRKLLANRYWLLADSNDQNEPVIRPR